MSESESRLQGWKDRCANYEDRIAELEAELAECQFQASTKSDKDYIAALEAENEHLKALLAATQKALIIEPGKTYVIEAPDYATTEEYEHLSDTWQEMAHSNVVILADGWRIARERVDGG